MDEKALLKHFDDNAVFRTARAGWSAEETNVFCQIATAVHGAGLDWWHVNISRSPMRFGRKSAGRKAAEGVQGYLNLKPSPNVSFNDQGACVDLGLEPIQFNPEGAMRLAKALHQNAAPIAAWKPPSPSRSALWPDEADAEQTSTITVDNQPMIQAPTNLILYGPPGTGKTFATAEYAVRLCGEEVPTDRTALMACYRELEAQKRIRFVTFHQSYAYEDFVEGLRPTTGVEGEVTSGGFRLEPIPGVFREIASLAEQAAKTAEQGGTPYDVSNRQVFKMSLGRAGVDDHIFEAALDGEYVVLGWGGQIDWTPFDSYEAIQARWNQDHPGTSDSNITQVWPFRCLMQLGDLVVASYGNSRFRAVGEIVGPYEYVPSDTGEYNHRRKVRWLYVPDEPLPISFYAKPFAMRSCYMLREDALNREALALLLPSSGGAPVLPKQFVLICDEINRANISKVFGELITLLEADKRIGMPNELRLALPYSKITDFGVPANLHVIGTMNTADRSIALLDTALRRRFTFEELMPKPDLPELAEASTACGVDLGKLLATLNDRIEYLFDREHQIGHAYFLGCRTRFDIDSVMRNKVIPLLAEYFYEDWTKVAVVLGDAIDGESNFQGGFLDRRRLTLPAGFGDFGEAAPRWRWNVRDTFDYTKLQ